MFLLPPGVFAHSYLNHPLSFQLRHGTVEVMASFVCFFLPLLTDHLRKAELKLPLGCLRFSTEHLTCEGRRQL